MTTRNEITARGPMMLIRGWAMAAVATVPAAALHGGADGHTPSAITLLVATVLSAAVCVPLIGKKFTRVRSGAAILASQALFHTFFSMTGTGHATVTSSGGTGAHSHHAMHSALQVTVSENAVGSSSVGSSAAGMHASAWMIAAHVIAALITVGLVWYGESLVRSILSAVGTAVANLSSLAGIARANLALPTAPRIQPAGVLPRPIASRVAELVQGRAPPVCV